MTHQQALDVSMSPSVYSEHERWQALIQLQFSRLYAFKPDDRRDAADGIERLIWYGRR